MPREQHYIRHACIDCGKERRVYSYDIANHKSLRCKNCAAKLRAKKFTGDKHWLWNGGKHLTTEGYIMTTLPQGDFFLPMAQGKRRYVLEHRLVMAQYLKRCLLPWETVHHKNGNKQDNRIENLGLFPYPYKHNGVSQLQKHIKRLEAENRRLRRQLAKE